MNGFQKLVEADDALATATNCYNRASRETHLGGDKQATVIAWMDGKVQITIAENCKDSATLTEAQARKLLVWLRGFFA